jgi:hypothetical protein
VYLSVFHAYINEMHGSRSIIPSKIFVRQRCAEGVNSGVKWLLSILVSLCYTCLVSWWVNYIRTFPLIFCVQFSFSHSCHNRLFLFIDHTNNKVLGNEQRLCISNDRNLTSSFTLFSLPYPTKQPQYKFFS